MKSKKQRLAGNKPSVTNHNDPNSPLNFSTPTNSSTVVSDASPSTASKDLFNNEDQNLDYFNSFPPGYRFHPTEEELITFYLSKKVKNEPLPRNQMVEVDIYKRNPEQICNQYRSTGEQEWYFFSPRERRYQNGSRPKRSAQDGYWKATGSEKPILSEGSVIGYWNTLVFYEGKAPSGTKTNWIMREYLVAGLSHERINPADMRLDDCVLCKVYKKAENSNNKTPRKRKKRGMKSSEQPTNDTSSDLSGEYGTEFVNQPSPEIPQDQSNNEVAAIPAFNQTALASDLVESFHYEPPSLEGITPGFTEPEMLQTRSQYNTPQLMVEPFHYRPDSVKDITPSCTFQEMFQPQYNNLNSDDTTIFSNFMMEPIPCNPPSPRFTWDQHCIQEDMGWSSVTDFDNFELLPQLDPIFGNNFDGQLIPWENILPNKPPNTPF